MSLYSLTMKRAINLTEIVNVSAILSLALGFILFMFYKEYNFLLVMRLWISFIYLFWFPGYLFVLLVLPKTTFAERMTLGFPLGVALIGTLGYLLMNFLNVSLVQMLFVPLLAILLLGTILFFRKKTP